MLEKKIFLSLTILIQNLLLAGKCKIKRKPVIHKLLHEVASLVLKKTDNNLILDITDSQQKVEYGMAHYNHILLSIIHLGR